MAHRPKVDFSHLHSVTCGVIFDTALRTRRHGGTPPRHLAETHRRLIAMFKGHADLTDNEAQARARAITPGCDWTPEFTARHTGNLLGWGLHMGAVEAGRARHGQRVWLMPDREPLYGILGGKAVRIRGLPPEEQALVTKRLRAQTKLNATLDERHARERAPDVTRYLGEIAQLDRAAKIPEAWHHYVPAHVLALEPTISEARGLLADLHWGWGRVRQRQWIDLICSEMLAARDREYLRKQEAKALRARLAEDGDVLSDIDL